MHCAAWRGILVNIHKVYLNTIQKYRVTLKNRKTKFTVFLPILPFLPVNFSKFTGKNGKRIFGKMENPSDIVLTNNLSVMV